MAVILVLRIIVHFISFKFVFTSLCVCSPHRKEPVRKSSPQGTLRHSLSSPIETQNSSGIQHSLPIELDAESANGKKLMAAVCGFSATMASHLETYVTEQSAMFCFMINFIRLSFLISVIYPRILEYSVIGQYDAVHV
jgi:hypothetical protein